MAHSSHSILVTVISLGALALSTACSSQVDLAGTREKVGSESTGGASTGGASNGGAATGSGGETADAGTQACGQGCRVVELRVPAGDSAIVQPGTEEWLCSSFHVDATAGEQATLATPVVDNADLLREFSLYKMSTPQTNGFAQTCPENMQNPRYNPFPPAGGTLEWAAQMGDGTAAVSFAIPPGDFMLATSYLNTTDHPQSDSSGVSLCICGG